MKVFQVPVQQGFCNLEQDTDKRGIWSAKHTQKWKRQISLQMQKRADEEVENDTWSAKKDL